MKLCFLRAEKLADGIALVAPDLGIELVAPYEAELSVTVLEEEADALSYSLDGKHAVITYGGGKSRFFRALAALLGAVRAGEEKKTVKETTLFKTNGTMVDMSRNAVMRVESVKTMMRAMALMGMNMYMLYTEDTYELEGRPWFGYMRGRYTKDEIKEMDAYALKLGIELIPCIQVLGHLGSHLRWGATGAYRDTANVLMVGAEETYALIEDMLKTVEECFTTRRIHVGMDETADIGLGAYLKKNGFRKQQDTYFEHLAKIIEMTRAHGLRPMMWSDMFFRLAGENLPGYYDYDERVEFTDEVIAKIPQGIQPVFWDYYRPREEFYATNIEKHQAVFKESTLFAGGIWLWSGFGPLFAESLRNTIPALEACRKHGVDEVIATVWHNGSEGSLMLSLAGMAWYADYGYRGEYSEESVKACFANATGASYDDIMKCELCEHPDPRATSATRALVYGDPLLGLTDAHLEGLDTRTYYRSVITEMEKTECPLGIFAPAYDTVYRTAVLLENKADFGVRLKAAYDARDRETLAALAEECDVITEKLNALRASHRASWMLYNKPFGWEVHDIRYGGQITRFATVKETILAYLAGELERIEELECERLRLSGGPGGNPFDGNFFWHVYRTFATPQAMI